MAGPQLLGWAAAVMAVVLAGGVLRAKRRGDASASCQAYYAGRSKPPASAVTWCRAGEYFRWASTLPENTAFGRFNIFYTCAGDPEKPALLLIHGYPTSSYDFARLVDALNGDFYLCALDTPGYGFSDKPKPSYHYSLFDDAQLVDYFIREVAGLKRFALVTHDKGDRVGLALLQIYQAYAQKPYTITHHFILNGNVYLPLAQLSALQKLLLRPDTGPVLSTLLNGTLLAPDLTPNFCENWATFDSATPVLGSAARCRIAPSQSSSYEPTLLLWTPIPNSVDKLAWSCWGTTCNTWACGPILSNWSTSRRKSIVIRPPPSCWTPS